MSWPALGADDILDLGSMDVCEKMVAGKVRGERDEPGGDLKSLS